MARSTDAPSSSARHSVTAPPKDHHADPSRLWPAADNGFADVFIREKARQLVAKARASGSDRDDIEQQLRIKLWRNQKSFDPRKGDWQAFAKTVVIRCAATIRRDGLAERRNPARARSLNVMVTNGDGRPVELAATIGESSVHPACRRHEEVVDLRLDVSQALGDLTAENQDLCASLKLSSISAAARDRGIPRTTLNGTIHKLRQPLEDAGLRIYLP